MNSWVKDSVPAALSPAATVVALERDLLLSSLSRPAGSAPPIAPGAVSEKAGASVRAAAEVVALVRRGEYVAALASAPARALLLADAGVPDALADASAVFAAVDASVAKRAAAAAHPDASPVEPAAHELLVLAVGVAALSAFQQANVTGPDLRRAPHCPALHDAPVDAADAWNRWATRALSLDGEDLVGRCFLPQYLYLARALLVERAAPRARLSRSRTSPRTPSPRRAPPRPNPRGRPAAVASSSGPINPGRRRRRYRGGPRAPRSCTSACSPVEVRRSDATCSGFTRSRSRRTRRIIVPPARRPARRRRLRAVPRRRRRRR